MADKVVALFVEGQTEIEFYKAVIKKTRELMNTPFCCKIEYIDMKGIGNYKNDALRKFNHLKEEYCDKDIYVFLCIDLDVFGLSKKPPFDRKKLPLLLEESGAKKVTYIIAKQSIEDWFLHDFSGVINYLHLPTNTKRPKGSGQEALKSLFKKGNKLYVKGGKTEGFIERLNITNIIKAYCSSLKPLCQILNLDCKKI